jgi:hypothetical protein
MVKKWRTDPTGSDWISVDTAKPIIPKGDYGMQVLITLHDPVYEEINPGKGSYVSTASYDGEWFKQLARGPKDWEWVHCGDIPTHWMYLPEPAESP